MLLNISLWVIAYGLIYLGGERLSLLLGEAHCVTAFLMLLYAVALTIRLFKDRKRAFYYDISFKIKPLDLLIAIPMLILPIINLLTVDISLTPFEAVLIMSVAVIEEVFFRNYLFLFINRKLKLMPSALISGLIFALFHSVNIFNNGDGLFIAMQMLSAFAVGVCFCAVSARLKSLTLAIFAHILINLTGAGIVAVSYSVWAIIIGAVSAVYLSFGLILLYLQKKKVLECN